MKNYQKIWEDHFGPIPLDEKGRSYHIHHIDGNRLNNDISNLSCISAQEHYDIHYSQKEFYSAYLIARNHLYFTEYQLREIKLRVGELHKDTVTVKDRLGNNYRVHKTDSRYTSGELLPTTSGFVTAKIIDTSETVYLSKEEFSAGKRAGIIVGITSGSVLSAEHKEKVSKSLTGIKRTDAQKENYRLASLGKRDIIHKITGERRKAFPVRLHSGQILISEINDNSEWRFVKVT